MRTGKTAALNDILQWFKSDLVLFLDADIVLEKNAILSLITPFLQNEKVGVCSGNTMPVEALKQRGIFEFASLFIREFHHELCSYLMSKGLAPKVNGTFYAFRRGIVDSFPRLVVSDDEYVSWQAQRKGYKIVYVPNASVFTRDPHSFRDFVKWQTRIIAGQFYTKRHYKYDVPTMQISVAVRGGLFKLLSKHRRKALSLLTLSLLGAVSFVLAYVKFVRGDVPYVY
jgi:cellulose synthase/poly-beta-1,6-N-acetylglucosamine synthase-like glycosyltransferase